MKTHIKLLLSLNLLLLIGSHLFCQYIVTPTDTLTIKDSTIVISFDEPYRGDVIWQYKGKKGLFWTDIDQETLDSLVVIIDSSAYYRAKIIEGTCDPIFTDEILIAELFDIRDGQIYNSVKIGNQWWTMENMNYKMPSGSYYYENDSIQYNKFGRLYTWNVAEDACPPGWHLPADGEWKTLESFLGIPGYELDIIGYRGTDQATQLLKGGIFGFEALLGGFMNADLSFSAGNYGCTFWTNTANDASTAWYRGMDINNTSIHRDAYNKNMAFSVRCIKNLLPVVRTLAVDSVTRYSAVINSILDFAGGVDLIETGICYDTIPIPTTEDIVIPDATGENEFVSHMTGLTPGMRYYVRTYAKNIFGTGYSDEDAVVDAKLYETPLIVVDSVYNPDQTSVTIGYSIPDDRGASVNQHGFCYSLYPSPMLGSADSVLNSNGTGSFVYSITTLQPNKTYYIKVFARNAAGVNYSQDLQIETKPLNVSGSIVDSRDGREYATLKIGYQWWLSENMDYYTSSGSWYLDDDSLNYNQYGRLYNWSTSQTVCTDGWHLPGDYDWKILEMYLGMSEFQADAVDFRGTDEGAKLKKGGESGFDVLFGGYRGDDGNYYSGGTGAAFWTDTKYDADNSWYRGFGSTDQIHRLYYDDDMAFSIRCIQDAEPELDSVYIDTLAPGYLEYTSSVFFDGGVTIEAAGICYGTGPFPEVDTDDTTFVSTALGEFSGNITDLTPNQTYYLRAYAKNTYGVGYGPAISIHTPIDKPTVITDPTYVTTPTTAFCYGNVTDNGGSTVTSKGVCYSEDPMPDTNDLITNNGMFTGSFTAFLSGLTINTTYYVRAYAINAAGTGYGDQIVIETKPNNPTGTVTDPRDSKEYQTIRIGTQLWMAENLDYNTGSGCWYYNNDTGYDEYGRLYNWTTANNACFSGWHLASDYEWKVLERTLGMSEYQSDQTGQRGTDQGTQLKKGGTSGFDVLLGGYMETDLSFVQEGDGGAFWTRTGYNGSSSWYRGFGDSEARVHRYYYDKDMGFSVRCLVDTIPYAGLDMPTSETDSSVAIQAEIVDDGGRAVVTKGLCYGLSPGPDIFDETTDDGSGIGVIDRTIYDLAPNETYYIRAYAINSVGVAYSNEMSFKTLIGRPEVTTTAVGTITDSSAVSGGTILEDGGDDIMERGICWSTTEMPEVETAEVAYSASGSDIYEVTLTDLDPNETYYVRAFVSNHRYRAYGQQETFTTDIGLPTVTTTAATSYTDSSIVCAGEVTDEGGGTVTAKGICYGTSPEPVVETDFVTNNGSGTGTYAATLSGLDPNTDYYYRAYATNSEGTGYGEEYMQTTNIRKPEVQINSSTPSDTSISVNGEVTYAGGGSIAQYGVCWNEIGNPDIVYDSYTSDGSGTGTYSSTIAPLDPSTDYYVRAYAINEADTAYSAQELISTIAGLPIVSTDAISYKTDSSIMANGNVTDEKGEPVTAKGFCWALYPATPTIETSDSNVAGSGLGTFSGLIEELVPNTQYNIRAYAKNSAGTGYGDVITITTDVALAEVTTDAVNKLTINSAGLYGNVTDDGSGTIEKRGFCWSESAEPEITDDSVNVGNGTGSFSIVVDGLDVNTSYYMRSFAINEAGVAYGEDILFTTKDTSSIVDARDNQRYKIVEIGSQWWMAENLNYFTDTLSWYYSDDSSSYVVPYGRLYSWHVSDTVCPAGWHLPTEAAWDSLVTELGGTTVAGGKLKSTGTTYWTSPNTGANNYSGFAAEPGGYRDNSGPSYSLEGDEAHYWTATSHNANQAVSYSMDYNSAAIATSNENKVQGFSIRCIQD